MDTRADSGSSSQANLSTKFYNSFIKFLNYFYKYWIPPLCIDFNNHNFGGLKTRHYQSDLLILQEFLLTEFSSENFSQCIFELFEIFDIKIIDNDPEFYKLNNIEVVFKFLKAFSNDNFKFKINNQERKFTAEQVSKFNIFKSKMLQVFNSNNVEHDEETINSNEIIEQTITQNEDLTNNTSFMNNLLKMLDEKLNNIKISIETENNKVIQSLFKELKDSINNSQNQVINYTQQTNNSSTTMNNMSLNSHFNYIKRRLTKKTKYLDRINQFNTHLENTTVPQELYYLNFPNPLFWDDTEYIKEHNRLIRDFQTSSMKFSINFMKEKIANIDKQLLTVKDQLKSDIDNIEQKFEEIQNSVNKNLEKELRKTDEKLKRFLKNNTTKEFSVRNIQNIHTSNLAATNKNQLHHLNNNASNSYSSINNNNSTVHTKQSTINSHVSHNNRYKTHMTHHNKTKFNNQNNYQYHSFNHSNNANNLRNTRFYTPNSYSHVTQINSQFQKGNFHNNNKQFNKQNIQHNNRNDFNTNTYHNNNKTKYNFQNNNHRPHLQTNSNGISNANNSFKRVRFLENRNHFQQRN